MKFKVRRLAILGLVLITYSCTHETTLQPETEPTVYFDTQILPVFQNSCAVSGCHSSGARGELSDLSSYASILKRLVPGDALKSSVYKVIIGKGEELMPPNNPLPIEQRNLIRLWIDQGAINTSEPSENTGSSDTTTVSGAEFCFEQDIHPILISNCATAGCHDASRQEEGYNFTTYETTVKKGIVPNNASQSKVYRVISGSGEEPMPPAPRAKLTQAEVDSIARWINEGALNKECAIQCNPEAIDFTANIAPVIQTYCRGCHQSSAANGGVTLETQAQITSIANDGRLLNTINATNGFPKMPPAGSLSSCDIERLTNWVNSLN